MSRPNARNMKSLKDQLRLFNRPWNDVGQAVTLFWLLDHVCGQLLPLKMVGITVFDRLDCLADQSALPDGSRIGAADYALLYALAAGTPEELNRSFIANVL